MARLRDDRDAVGKDITIRINANHARTPKQPIKILNSIQDQGLDIELVEQPVAAPGL